MTIVIDALIVTDAFRKNSSLTIVSEEFFLNASEMKALKLQSLFSQCNQVMMKRLRNNFKIFLVLHSNEEDNKMQK